MAAEVRLDSLGADGLKLAKAVREALTRDLLPPDFWGPPHPTAGHCYTASQVFYHLTGKHYRLMRMRPRNLTNHFYLVDPNTGDIVDLTADQFDFPLDYGAGAEMPLRTKRADAVARKVIQRVRGKEGRKGET